MGTDSLNGQSVSREKWYEFEQRETFRRPLYVKAASISEARERLHSGDTVPDWAPTHPDMEIGGRGRIAADQQYVQDLADSPERRNG